MTVFIACFGLQGCRPTQAATFHVDYVRGSDEADGLSAATAWKHAPGDPEATGRVARTLLRPGDTIRFAAGVRYRGSIVVGQSGSAGAPITFIGDQGAIIDGSDPVISVQPCTSASECGGAERWKQLVRIKLPYAVSPDVGLFSEEGALRPAQWPDPKDDFYRDEVADMAEVDGSLLAQGQLPLPKDLAQSLSPGARLALWVFGNQVEYRPMVGTEGQVARFDATGLRFYTDRPDRAAVIGHPAVIDRPGEYALLPDGRTVVAMLPLGAGSLSVANGRHGLYLRSASHVVVQDLTFERFGDGGHDAPDGVAVFGEGRNVLGLRIENNQFRHFVMPKGQGPIILRGVSDAVIRGNVIGDIVLGSGMRLAGPAHGYLIEDNTITRIGRTGILLLNIDQAVVRRNRITDVRGVHGNGLSAYLNNHDIRFIANTVLDAKQPATFHGGDAASGPPNNIIFENNLLIASPGALGALISWGRSTRGVQIRRNVLQGGAAGLRLNATDSDVEVEQNVSNGLLVSAPPPDRWRVEGNVWTSLTYQQQRLSPSPQVTPGFSEIGKALADGRAPANLCRVILGGAEAQAAQTTLSSDAIGADIRCPR